MGEAGGVAPAYSLICDYFPRHARGRALAVYSFGIPIGSALGILAGGFITRWLSWRMAFFIVGLADKAVTESRERVRAAFAGLGLAMPSRQRCRMCSGCLGTSRASGCCRWVRRRRR